MQIGELFLNLGIKGTEKTIGALTTVKEGIGKLGSMSLEAKAAIIAMLYALERLASTSAAFGTNLKNLGSLLNVNTKTLQEYQYAARQVGATNEDMAASFLAVQQGLTKQLTGQGNIAGLAQVARVMGGIPNLADMQQHPEKMIQFLEQYSAKEQNKGLRLETLKSFGFNDKIIAGIIQNVFRPDVFAKAQPYSDQQLKNLNKSDIGMSNIEYKWEKLFGDLTASRGPELIKSLDFLSTQIISLIEIINKFVPASGKMIDGVNNFVNGKGNQLFHSKDLIDGIKNGMDKLKGTGPNGYLAPQQKQISPANKQVTVHSQVTIHGDVKDPQRVVDGVKKSHQQAFRQMGAAGGW